MSDASSVCSVRTRAVALASFLAVSCACAYPEGAAPSQRVRFRAIYSDLDGTLLDETGHVRAEARASLERYRRCGGLLGVATGRAVQQVKPLLGEIGPSLPLVLQNGAVLVSPDMRSIRALATLDGTLVLKVIDAVGQRARGLIVHYSNASVADRDDAYIEQYSIRANAAGMATCYPIQNCVRNESEQATKVQVLVPPADAEGTQHLLRDVLSGLPARVVIADTTEASVEIVASAADKLTGISEALKGSGVTVSEVVAFGDSDNDIEMLRGVAVGVAMSHCTPKACEAALLIGGRDESRNMAAIIDTLATGSSCPP